MLEDILAIQKHVRYFSKAGLPLQNASAHMVRPRVDALTSMVVDRAYSGSTGNKADLLLVAPATANVVAQFTYGLTPDALSSIHRATRAKVVLAPAMNGKMYDHPATQENLRALGARGVLFVDPEEGELACGYEGVGRLATIEKIVEKVLEALPS